MSALSISSISSTGRTRLEGLPELALLDVVADVLDPLVAQLAVAQAGDGVVFVEALLALVVDLMCQVISGAPMALAIS
jgi:hypothetical protein